jgi:hypothetical protein
MMSARKTVPRILFLILFSAVLPYAHAVEASKVKTADFAWMTGRWIGHLSDATAEQICSQPNAGEMLCLFRLFQNDKPVMFELYTMLDTANGPELRSLHFPTDLNEKTAQAPLVMALKSYSDKEVVFAGAPGTDVVTSTLARKTPTTMTGTIVLTNPKEPHIEVHWEKTDYAAPMR